MLMLTQTASKLNILIDKEIMTENTRRVVVTGLGLVSPVGFNYR